MSESCDDLLQAALEYVEAAAQPVLSYGVFLGGDPRAFDPDPEVCLPEQIAAWREICARWDAGDPVEVGSEVVIQVGGRSRLVSLDRMMGGMYSGDPPATELVAAIRAYLGMAPWAPRKRWQP